ncbi:MAG: nucleotide exchange factor GrpE [Peptococcia bacterium]
MVEDRIDEEKVNEEKQPEEMTVEEYSLPGNNHPEGKAGKRDNEDNDDNEGNRDASAGREINLAETEKLKAELKEAQERLLRAHADFDNYRKRINKEKEEWMQYSCMGLIEKLLPVLDNFDLAMSSLAQQSEETRKTFAGISMIIKQLQDALQKEGLQPIEAMGKEFDPVYHEAVMQVPAEEGMAANQIIEELRKGYLFKDKVLRAAMVKVTQGN